MRFSEDARRRDVLAALSQRELFTNSRELRQRAETRHDPLSLPLPPAEERLQPLGGHRFGRPFSSTVSHCVPEGNI